MDLPSVLAAPRWITLAGEVYRVPPATIGDFAEILQWLTDTLGPGEGGGQRLFSSPDSQEAMVGVDGLSLITYLALRKCHPGITISQAREAMLLSEQADRDWLLMAFFRRRPTKAEPSAGEGCDLALNWWGPIVDSVAQKYGITYDDVAQLTIDQLDNAVSDGKCERDPRALDVRQVQAMWEAAQRNGPGNGAEHN